jgi:uncharacterized protein (DUF427 family)
MKAVWNDQVVAEAPEDQLIKIEGNWYFPPEAVKQEFFTPTDQHTECFWKGTASYYDVEANGQKFENGAWYYPEPKEGSVERVKKDFAGYVAFYPQITVTA